MYEIPERYKAKFKSGTVLNRACEAYGDYLKEEANNKDDEYEEGEEEYPEEYLKEKNMAVLKIEEFDQLNTVFFKNCERNYHPA